MKKVKRIAGVLAFTAIIVFTLTAAACGGSKPYTSKTGDGAAYTLTVTDNKGKVSTNPQEGDTYTLKIKFPNKDTLTSGGTITNVNYSSGALELTQEGESEILKVTINSGGNITDIKGAIKLSGGALSLSEEELTAVTSGAALADPGTIETRGGLLGFISGLLGGKKTKSANGASKGSGASDGSGGLSGLLGGLLGGGSTTTGTGGGMKWTLVEDSTFDNTITIHAIAYGGGKFVAGSDQDRMACSSDGVTWTAVENKPFNTTRGEIYAIGYGGGKFVASFSSTNNSLRAATSTDGVVWTGLGTSFRNYLNNSNGIAWGNNTFVSVGGEESVYGPIGHIKYSSDGVNWTNVEDISAFSFTRYLGTTELIYPAVPVRGIAFGNNTFVAVGSLANDTGKIAYSTDNGKTWTPVENSTFDNCIDAIAFGNGTFVAVGRYGKIWYSSNNGKNWNAVTTTAFNYTNPHGNPATHDINAIAYGNNKFVAVGDDGRIAASPDGVTWTAVADAVFGNNSQSGLLNDINAIAYGNGTFVAVSYDGKIAYSKD